MAARARASRGGKMDAGDGDGDGDGDDDARLDVRGGRECGCRR